MPNAARIPLPVQHARLGVQVAIEHLVRGPVAKRKGSQPHSPAETRTSVMVRDRELGLDLHPTLLAIRTLPYDDVDQASRYYHHIGYLFAADEALHSLAQQ